jgi:hypothetical protein
MQTHAQHRRTSASLPPATHTTRLHATSGATAQQLRALDTAARRTQQVCGDDGVGAAQERKGLAAHALWALHALGLGLGRSGGPLVAAAAGHAQDVLDICVYVVRVRWGAVGWGGAGRDGWGGRVSGVLVVAAAGVCAASPTQQRVLQDARAALPSVCAGVARAGVNACLPWACPACACAPRQPHLPWCCCATPRAPPAALSSRTARSRGAGCSLATAGSSRTSWRGCHLQVAMYGPTSAVLDKQACWTAGKGTLLARQLITPTSVLLSWRCGDALAVLAPCWISTDDVCPAGCQLVSW